MSSKQLAPHALKDVRVLVVDDEDILAWGIETELRALGAEVTRAGSVREALERFGQACPDLAICDLRLPDGNGLELLKKWRHEQADMPVILITAHGAIDSAITALRLGAFDYLQKPFDMKALVAAVRRSAEMAKLRQKLSGLTAAEAPRPRLDIIGAAPAMKTLKGQLERIAKSKATTALVLGESGSGKELAARAIHEWSERSAHAFVEINCASIPETLLESELFGYEKGAFTDARERKLGLFEVARNGTIFLDEIGELPLKLQAKLLRVLEQRRFKRLGGIKDVEFTGRIVAATHRNLRDEVAHQRFRSDLYYRLNVLPVVVPSLRERREDIAALTDHLLLQLADELGVFAPSVAAEARERLAGYDWPGNVRELKNVLQRALVFHEPKVLLAKHVEFDERPAEDLQASKDCQQQPEPFPSSATSRTYSSQSLGVAPLPKGASLTASPQPEARSRLGHDDDNGQVQLPIEGINLEKLERSLLVQALERAHNNQTRAAQLLGITRHTLRYRLEKHGLMLDSSSEGH